MLQAGKTIRCKGVCLRWWAVRGQCGRSRVSKGRGRAGSDGEKGERRAADRGAPCRQLQGLDFILSNMGSTASDRGAKERHGLTGFTRTALAPALPADSSGARVEAGTLLGGSGRDPGETQRQITWVLGNGQTAGV